MEGLYNALILYYTLQKPNLPALATAIIKVSLEITSEIKQQARRKLMDCFEYTGEELAKKLNIKVR